MYFAQKRIVDMILNLIPCFPGEHWMQIFTGLEKSPCATPCTTFHTKTKFLSSVKEKKDDSFRFKLYFIPEMMVTTTDFVKPTISSMLSEVAILLYNHPKSKSIESIAGGGLIGSLAWSWCRSGVPAFYQMSFTSALPAKT